MSDITHAQQDQVKKMLESIRFHSKGSAGFTMEIMWFANSEEQPEREFSVWVGLLKHNFKFPTIEELLAWEGLIIKIIEAHRIEQVYSEKYCTE